MSYPKVGKERLQIRVPSQVRAVEKDDALNLNAGLLTTLAVIEYVSQKMKTICCFREDSTLLERNGIKVIEVTPNQ